MNTLPSPSRKTLAWTFDAMRQDLRRYSRDAPLPVVFLRSIYLHPALAGILYYRIGHWLWLNRRNPLILLLFICYLAFYPLVRMYSGLELLPQTTVGPGLQVLHLGPTVIHYQAIIGSNVTLLHGVTIGVAVIGISNIGAPRIGNNVAIGAGAAILGDITIGDNVTIGANAVVTRPVPADTTVVGVPGKPVLRDNLYRGNAPVSVRGSAIVSEALEAADPHIETLFFRRGEAPLNLPTEEK